MNDQSDGVTLQSETVAASATVADTDPDVVPGNAGLTGLRRTAPTDDMVHRLLVGYSDALDAIAARPAFVFQSHRSGPKGRFWPHLLVPGANFMASILAEARVAARVDTLLCRAQRFRALDSGTPGLLDVDHLQDFRNSLSPVKRRTLILWVVLLTLAVAFPVAWITDHLRTLAPNVIICSSRFSVRYVVAKLTGSTLAPVTSSCQVHTKGSLVGALVHAAHLNLSPGSVIDAFRTVSASGLVVVLLLAVIWILCLSVVLLVFRSGFRLMRSAFVIEQHSLAPQGPRSGPAPDTTDLYIMEREVFAAVGLRSPREFPLDLAASAGLLVLPLTIAADLFRSATLPRLDQATVAVLVTVSLALALVVLVRLWSLVQAWRGRIGLTVTSLRERVLPDGTVVLVRTGVYGAILLATGYVAWGITLFAAPSTSAGVRIAGLLLGVPFVAWPLGTLWWYRLHRELASCGRCVSMPLFRAPILSIVPPLFLVALVVFFFWHVKLAAPLTHTGSLLVLDFGFIGALVSVYRMGQKTKQLRLRAIPHTAWKARAAGLGAVMTFVVPVVSVLYFQRALNKILPEIAEPAVTHLAADAVADPTTAKGDKPSAVRKTPRFRTILTAGLVVAGVAAEVAVLVLTLPHGPAPVELVNKIIRADVSACRPLNRSHASRVGVFLFCDTHDRAIGLFAYQFNNYNYYNSWYDHLNTVAGWKTAAIGRGCPPPTGSSRGIEAWHATHGGAYKASSSAQFLECFRDGHRPHEVLYLWTLPSQRVILLAVPSSSSTSYSHINKWWASLTYR